MLVRDIVLRCRSVYAHGGRWFARPPSSIMATSFHVVEIYRKFVGYHDSGTQERKGRDWMLEGGDRSDNPASFSDALARCGYARVLVGIGAIRRRTAVGVRWWTITVIQFFGIIFVLKIDD